MKFVNLKLFKDIGLEYPPPEDNSDLPYFGFNSMDIRSLQEKVNSKSNKENLKEEVNMESEEMKRILDKEEENKKQRSLFKNFVFFIGREVPNEIFSLAIMSCGGLYGDETENSSFKQDDPRITHYIVDRPAEFVNMQPNKEYVQPQWVFDCINRKTLLPTSEFKPGNKLPAHLSPFYEIGEDGNYIYNKDDEEEEEEAQEEVKAEKEQTELKEMMISKNKKKLLEKIREEKNKKRKRPTVSK